VKREPTANCFGHELEEQLLRMETAEGEGVFAIQSAEFFINNVCDESSR
jgi:hypothetical protein